MHRPPGDVCDPRRPVRASFRPPIVLTSEDRERLLSLKDDAMERAPEVVRFLLEELERADIVSPSAVIASPLVRMGSEVNLSTMRQIESNK